jgi:general secretion pathway protein G
MKAALGILFLVVIAGGIHRYKERLWPDPPTCGLNRIDADFNAIGSSLKTYRLNAGHYPSNRQGLEALVSKPTTDPVPRRWVKIADRIPTDPWNNEYRYRLLPEEDDRGFELLSAGKDGQFGTKDDLTSLDE